MAAQNLKDRAAEAAGKPPSTEVAQTDRKRELASKLTAMEKHYQLAMPKGMEAAQIIRDVHTAISRNPKLIECEPNSILGAVMTCAQLGLRPGVLGQAWILPFWDKQIRGHRAQFILGYPGAVILCHRSGMVKSISSRVVHANDVFDAAFGLDEYLTHKPAEGDRGPSTRYYSIVKSNSGGVMWDLWTRTDAELHRDKFATSKRKDGTIFGPWVDHFDAMASKSVLLSVLKLSPRSTEVQGAIIADQSVRVDLTPNADLSDPDVTIATSNEDDGIQDAELVEDRPAAPADPDSLPLPDEAWRES